jgi:uncharacterized OB-fold protein
MASEIEHPLPYASWETRGYWEGCGRDEIVLQRCTDCGGVQHRPRAVCAHCLSGAIEHFVASGRGHVHTFTVTHQNQVPGFREACPYVMAYVQLEEGPRILTNVVGCDPADVRIDMPVVATFVHQERKDGEAFAVPCFRPA